MEEKKPFSQVIGKVEIKPEPLAVDKNGNLEQRLTLEVEGINPEHLKKHFRR